jgi:hypothetical protein
MDNLSSNYRYPRRLKGALQILTLTGVGLSFFYGLLIIPYSLASSLDWMKGVNSDMFLGFIAIVFILEFLVYIISQVFFLFWVRRLALNAQGHPNAPNPLWSWLSFLIPIIHWFAPFYVLKNLFVVSGAITPQDRRPLVKWWLLIQASNPLVLTLLLFIMATYFQVSMPEGDLTLYITSTFFIYTALASSARNYMGFKLIQRLGQISHSKQWSQEAVSVF